MNSIFELLDDIFLLSEEMVAEHGEDSYYCWANGTDAIVSVFDGCGGLGARTYEQFKGHTGAYVAARVVSTAVRDWFRTNCGRRWESPQALVANLREAILQGYQLCTAGSSGDSLVKGSMVREFPTTAAIALLQVNAGEPYLHILWAGDSRVYIMDEDGLAQLTPDDLEGEDAMSNLSNDGALTNLLSSDGSFTLHYRCMQISKPSMIFAASDGCFGYLSSPMEFEGKILECLLQAEDPEGWKESLKSQLAEVAGDDLTLGLMSLGFGSYSNLQAAMRPRYESLKAEALDPIDKDHSDASLQAAWETYRKNYERYL